MEKTEILILGTCSQVCSDMSKFKPLTNPAMFKVNNRNTRKKFEICSKVFLLLILNIFTPFSSVSIVDFQQVNVSWEVC